MCICMKTLRKRTRRINAKVPTVIIESSERNFVFYSMYFCTVLIILKNV